jgi:hypothetical protein
MLYHDTVAVNGRSLCAQVAIEVVMRQMFHVLCAAYREYDALFFVSRASVRGAKRHAIATELNSED